MKLSDLKMDELRGLAFDLEALLDREVETPRKKKDLVAELDAALAELDPKVASDVLKSKGVDDDDRLLEDAAESTESEPEAEAADGGDEADEAPEGEAPAAENPVEGHDFNPPAKRRSKPFAIQVREHPMNGRINYGDLIKDPSDEALANYTHVALNEKGFDRLRRHGYPVKQG